MANPSRTNSFIDAFEDATRSVSSVRFNLSKLMPSLRKPSMTASSTSCSFCKSSSPLRGVTYDEARNGAIKVIPNGQTYLQTITVTVKKSSDTTKTGTATAVKGLVNVSLNVNPSDNTVIDGTINLPYSLDVQACVPATSFSWSAVPQNTPAGNDPHLDFLPYSAQQNVTIANANWYAYPADDECACLQSTYLLTAQAVVNNDVHSDTKSLTVYIPEYAAYTPPPEVRYENIDIAEIGGAWKMLNGNFSRYLGPTVYYLPTTSQFYSKMVAHENVHINQNLSGISSDISLAEPIKNRLEGLRAHNAIALMDLIYDEKTKYDNEEGNKFGDIYKEMERLAYVVSDPILPMYFYQWNCVKDRIK